MSRRRVNYIHPGDGDKLDKNKMEGKFNTFPYHIYDANTVPAPESFCASVRDTEFDYMLGVERDIHPDHFSRFGRNTAHNGYGSGHWPGRYLHSQWYRTEEPEGMAPPRFYKEPKC